MAGRDDGAPADSGGRSSASAPATTRRTVRVTGEVHEVSTSDRRWVETTITRV
jgi:beta-glucosidase